MSKLKIKKFETDFDNFKMMNGVLLQDFIVE